MWRFEAGVKSFLDGSCTLFLKKDFLIKAELDDGATIASQFALGIPLSLSFKDGVLGRLHC